MELSGEHPNLPAAECLAALEALGASPQDVRYEPRFLVVRPPAPLPALAERLAFARGMGPVLLQGPVESVLRKARHLDLGGARFRARVVDGTGGSDVPQLEGALGAALGRTGRVDLEDPEVDLRLLTGTEACLFHQTAVVDRSRFERRKAEARPYFQPVGLHPRLARALVNLTAVAPGETLLDPFCGMGGILMEAGLSGIVPVGSDRNAEAVRGCRENLTAFHLEAELRVADVGDLPAQDLQVDAIATDPPYGRAASTAGEDLDALMGRAFRSFARLLRVGGRVALSLPDPALADISGPGLRLLEWHGLRVHRSLTRTFAVFERV